MVNKPADVIINETDFRVAWQTACRRINNEGMEILSTNDDSGVITKDAFVAVTLTGNALDQIKYKDMHPDYPLGKDAIEKYCSEMTFQFVINQLGSKGIGKFVYDYMSRITRYAIGRTFWGKPKYINQLIKMRRMIKCDGPSRRNLVITWQPEVDQNNPSPPCLQQIQIRAINETDVELFTYWRSRDVHRAWPSNVCAIVGMINEYVIPYDMRITKYTDISVCAHLYESSWDEVDNIKDIATFRGV